MKKTLLLLVSCLVLLAQFGCNKDTKNNPNNPGGSGGTEEQDPTGSLIPYFDLGESLLGLSVTQAKSTLSNQGWEYQYMEDESQPTEYVFKYKNEKSASVMLSFLAYSNKNVVLSLDFKMNGWDDDSFYAKEKAYLNLIKYVGNTYTMKSGKTYTFLEEDFSYNELVSNFSNIFKRDFWRAMWQQGSKWDNGTILMYKYTNSFELGMEDNSYKN